ncbi:MAG: hypothetical protein WA960_16185 [Tunicatimonas sp.]
MPQKQDTSENQTSVSSYAGITDWLQSVLATGYLSLIVIGMVYEALYYRAFGINIFEYAEVLDFLLVPFRRPITLWMLLVIFGLGYGGYRFDLFLERKHPRFHRYFNFGLTHFSWFKRYRMLSYTGVAIILIGFTAWFIGEDTSEDMRAEKRADTAIEYVSPAEPAFRGKKIGKNGSYFFLMDNSAKIHIIPIDSHIQEIQPISP